MKILNNFHPKLDWTFSLMISTILSLFAGSVEYGGDRAQLKYDLACMLSLSIIIFAVSTVASRVVLGEVRGPEVKVLYEAMQVGKFVSQIIHF